MISLAFPRGSDNVGDELNAWLWPALLGDLMTDRQGTLLGIGTLLNASFCRQVPENQNVFVLGTGAGYGGVPAVDHRWKFYAVRGPRTAAALGLPEKAAVADAAYLLAGVDWRQGPRAKVSKKVVVVPHHRSLPFLDWEAACQQAGLEFLSPLLPAEQFMRRLCSATLVLAEAMHGAILSDMVRTPWRAFSFGRQFNANKWFDWSEALGVKLQTTRCDGFYDPFYATNRVHARHKHAARWVKAALQSYGLGKAKWESLTPPSWSVERDTERLASILSGLAISEGQLSCHRMFSLRTDELLERVNILRHDLGGGPCSGVSGPAENFFQASR